jgi:hypothetical protein
VITAARFCTVFQSDRLGSCGLAALDDGRLCCFGGDLGGVALPGFGAAGFARPPLLLVVVMVQHVDDVAVDFARGFAMSRFGAPVLSGGVPFFAVTGAVIQQVHDMAADFSQVFTVMGMSAGNGIRVSMFPFAVVRIVILQVYDICPDGTRLLASAVAIWLLHNTPGLHHMSIDPVPILGRDRSFGIPSPAGNWSHRHFLGPVPTVVVNTAPTRISLLTSLTPRSCAPRSGICGNGNPTQRPFCHRPSIMRAPAPAMRRLCPLCHRPRTPMIRMRAPPSFLAVALCLSVTVAMRFPGCTGLAGNAHPRVATVFSAGFARGDGGFLYSRGGDAATGTAARPDARPGETAHRLRLRVVAGGKKRYRGVSGYIYCVSRNESGDRGGWDGLSGAVGNAMARIVEHGSPKKQYRSCKRSSSAVVVKFQIVGGKIDWLTANKACALQVHPRCSASEVLVSCLQTRPINASGRLHRLLHN